MASRFPSPAPARRGGPMMRRPRYVDPFSLLQREMNRLLEDVSRGSSDEGTADLPSVPRIDLQETDKEIRVTAELPGVNLDDLEVRLEDDVLILRGDKRIEREEDRQGLHLAERVYGQFQRSIPLPFAPDPDRVAARMENGILTVILPKPEQQQERARRINVQGGDGAGQSSQQRAGAQDEGKEQQGR